MIKKIYIVLITTICGSFASCISDNQATMNNSLNVSFVADIANQNMQTRSIKSSFTENDNIGVYLVDYVENTPMPIGTISTFMNTEHIYDGNVWHSKDGDELYLSTDLTKANLYAYYPFDYEISRAPDKLDLRAYPFSVELDQSLNSQKSDFLWAKYSGLSISNTIAKLTFKHILTKVVINLKLGNLEIGNEQVKIQNLTKDALIDIEDGNVIDAGTNFNSEITPYTQNIANTGFDKTLNAIIIPQFVSSGTSLFSVSVNNELYAFTLENAIVFESGYSYTFNLIVGEANVRSSKTVSIEKRISLISKISF